MDDPFNNYETITLAHQQDDPVVESMKNAGLNVNDLVNYRGFRGPIKIWDVREIPSNINELEEWKGQIADENYGEFDNAQFIN